MSDNKSNFEKLRAYVAWAHYQAELAIGNQVQFRPQGNSMQPRIESGNLVTVAPCKEDELQVDDIVFCKVKGRYFVHRIEAIREKMGGRLFQIGNNKQHTNGTIDFDRVFGKVVKVEP